ncbi:MAG: MFS transporter [Cellulosilyticaceae bacterium]
MDTISKSKGTDSRALVRCFYYAFFINGMLATMMGSILPMMQEEYGLSYGVSGMMLSSHSIGNLIASFIAGVLPIYLGRKKSIMILSFFTCIGFAVMTIWGNPFILIACFFGIGIGRGSVSNISNVVVAEVSEKKEKSLNMLHSIFAIGAFIAPFIALMATAGNIRGWKIGALIISVLCIGLQVAFFKSTLSSQPLSKKEVTEKSYGFLKNKKFLISVGILFFYLCAETTINGWLITYLKDTGVMSTGYAQVMASLLWMLIMVGRMSCAYISQKVDRKYILIVTTIGMALCFVGLISTQNIGMITLIIVGLGLFMAGIYPTTIANISNVITIYPMAIGTILSIGGIGSIIMPSITGMIAERIGIQGGMASISVVVVIMVFCAIINSFIKEEVTGN